MLTSTVWPIVMRDVSLQPSVCENGSWVLCSLRQFRTHPCDPLSLTHYSYTLIHHFLLSSFIDLSFIWMPHHNINFSIQTPFQLLHLQMPWKTKSCSQTPRVALSFIKSINRYNSPNSQLISYYRLNTT